MMILGWGRYTPGILPCLGVSKSDARTTSIFASGES
jgi:hypothetical protein